MKQPIIYKVRPRALFDVIYQNTDIQWAFTECLDTMLLYDIKHQDVVFLTIYSEHLLNRLISLTKKFNNLKYIKNGD